MAQKTKCLTPGSQFHTSINKNQVSISVDLPFDIGEILNDAEGELLENLLHNQVELVLSPYFNNLEKTSFNNWYNKFKIFSMYKKEIKNSTNQLNKFLKESNAIKKNARVFDSFKSIEDKMVDWISNKINEWINKGYGKKAISSLIVGVLAGITFLSPIVKKDIYDKTIDRTKELAIESEELPPGYFSQETMDAIDEISEEIPSLIQQETSKSPPSHTQDYKITPVKKLEPEVNIPAPEKPEDLPKPAESKPAESKPAESKPAGSKLPEGFLKKLQYFENESETGKKNINGQVYYFKYLDSKDIPTLGPGFNLNERHVQKAISDQGYNINEILSGESGIKQQDIENILKTLVQTAENDSRKYVKNYDKLPTGVKSIVLDLSYNMGSNLRKFPSARKYFESLELEKAALELIYSNPLTATGGKNFKSKTPQQISEAIKNLRSQKPEELTGYAKETGRRVIDHVAKLMEMQRRLDMFVKNNVIKLENGTIKFNNQDFQRLYEKNPNLQFGL
jgi:hypothetical protein